MSKPTRRNEMSVDEYKKNICEIIEYIESVILRKKKEKEFGIQEMQKIRNAVMDLEKGVDKVIRSKRRRKPGEKPHNTGLTTPVKITDELAEFLGYNSSDKEPPISRSEISRSHINNAVCVYVNYKVDETREKINMWGKCMNPTFKSLQDPDNKRRIIPDEKLQKLLDYDLYTTRVNKGEVTTSKGKVVSDPSLYYFNLVSLIQKHIIK